MLTIVRLTYLIKHISSNDVDDTIGSLNMCM